MAFPSKIEDLNLILNCKYEEISEIINKRVEEFFSIYDTINEKYINGENENEKSILIFL